MTVDLTAQERTAVLDTLMHMFEVNASAYPDDTQTVRQTCRLKSVMKKLAKAGGETKSINGLFETYSDVIK